MLCGLVGVGGFFGGALSGEGGGSVTPVALRGTDQDRATNASLLAFTFPVGTQVGDQCVLFASGAWAPSTPVGWTMLTEANGVNINGEIMHKVLTSGDISAGSVTVSFAASGICTVAGAVFEGDPAIRDYHGERELGGGVTPLTIDAEVGDYVIFYAGTNADFAGVSPSCSKGSILETTADDPWLELTGLEASSGDISTGTITGSWTTTGADSYLAVVSVIAATYSTEDRVTSTSEQRLTSTGDVRITTERTA